MDPFKEITWETSQQRLVNKDGEVIWESEVEFPSTWSDTARTVVSEKYLCNSARPETSLKQLVNRVSDQITEKGEELGYFKDKKAAKEFNYYLKFFQVHQYFAFNSPVYFNAGLSDDPQLSACLTYDSPINTPDGFSEIGHIVEHGLIGQKVLDDEGVTVVENVQEKGIKPVWKITDRNGYHIKVTADHLVASAKSRKNKGYDFVEAGDLSVNSYMRLIKGSTIYDNKDPLLEAELAVAGWLQTDGFVGKSPTSTSLTVEFETINDEEREWLYPHIEKVFPKIKFCESHRATEDPNVFYEVKRAYGEHFRNFVNSYRLEDRKASKRVPEKAYNCPIPYLRSVFQADGHVSINDTSAIILGSVSEPFLEGIQTILMSMGILSSIVPKRPNRLDNYTLHISWKECRQTFQDLIGFQSDSKKESLKKSLLF